MKAAIITHYGSEEALHYTEVAQPKAATGEVLVRVHAAAINSWDWEIIQGTPFANRLMAGLFKPSRLPIIGCDIAGAVEAVGPGVDGFAPGDAVFGDLSSAGWGGFAEYVAAPASALSPIPSGLNFVQAAAVPQAGLLAYQALHTHFSLRTGQRVLINGASGGAGSFAVQLARLEGAEVTGTCRTEKMDFVRSLGADQVIDYTREDFTRSCQQYDLIIDMQAHHSPRECAQVLTAGGLYQVVGGESGHILHTMLLSLVRGRRYRLLLHRANRGLDRLSALLSSGAIRPHIDRVYPLAEAAEAMRYYGEGHARGKVVISMLEPD